MIPSSDTTSINSALFLICSISPTAASSMENEGYRQSVDTDESTQQHILESAFINLTKDLESLGLIFDIDYAEVFEDLTALFTFLTFVSYLLPNPLYQILKTHDQVKSCVYHLLEGGLGDNETLIQTYLSELGGLDGQDPLVPELSDFIDHYYLSISQSEVFTDYMRNLYQLIQDERLVPDSDEASHNAYQTKIRDLISRFAEAVSLFSDDPLYADLERLQNHFILDLISATNFVSYNYLFAIPKDTIPDDLLPSYKKQWYHYNVSNIWCADYYQVRKIVPTSIQLTAIYCFLYASNKDEEAYTNEVTRIASLFPSPSIKQKIDALYKSE